MEIKQLNLNPEQINNDKVKNLYDQMQQLIEKLNIKKLPSEIVQFINQQIEDINSTTLTGFQLYKFLKKIQTAIIKKLEADHKIVPKNYYRNLWTAVGMSAFGLPLGVVFGLSMGNIGLMALGLPIGLAVGVGVGTSMDKKALAEGRQIDMELKF
ncbi:hypothetical protein IX39_11925 [Chryseobacterium formosense]|uniref:Glycine zipper family protein n=1 Tax=Chryseobacterium formosense TaxID=236814 RepID=A0A085ZA23_9FLAO|nr:hypothetical protein [Chryseobacterium formosense]KFF01287.1 hypothetical protein IX39_11925 [Chryseobacterium formosense]SFT45099.1 hypothetical protein SAMN05421857_1076 [Chryseobacterium formosense]